VSGRADLSCEIGVPRGGRIVLPGAGAVRIAGRSVEELSQEIATLLEAREFLTDARVVVTVASRGIRKTFISGAVTQVRSVALPPESEMTLTQAIASCGGFSEEADRARVRIIRREDGASPRVLFVDAEAISKGETPSLDPVLAPGDTVYVPRREPVYVMGQVANQGAYQIPNSHPLTVAKAISLAGGLTPYARHSRVRVTRRASDGVEVFSVDVGDVLMGRLDADVVVRPGDIIYVPERIF
jgi:polysaccharide export outer membrane protein